MEPAGAISEGEWGSFYGMYSEEADFMAQLLSNCSIPTELPVGSNFTVSSNFWSLESNLKISGAEEDKMYSSDETNTSMYSFLPQSSYGGGSSILFPSASPKSYYPGDSHQFFMTNNSMMSSDNCTVDGKDSNSPVEVLANNAKEGDDFLNQDVSNDSIETNENQAGAVLRGKSLQVGGEHVIPMPEPCLEDNKVNGPSEMSKKRPRNSGEVQKSTRSMKLRRVSNLESNNEDNNNAVIHKQSSSGCCSDEESNASHELNGGVASSSSSKGNGKSRASRGSATDPQSLYARKRRERINERLRILQSLVPNGTKVDISTMLEEAVQYVKFLQLQIKLLSSDDLWMYAPIAYNGMDIGLDLKIGTPKS